MAGKVAIFRIPAQITFGGGAAETVGTEAKRLGATHAFVVSDPNLQKLGVTERIVASLSAQGVRSTVYAEIEFEPSVQSIAPASAAAAKASGCDLVIGLGGGSTLDTAKAVAVLTRNAGRAEDYLGIGLVKQRGVPSILMPTTGGTGAEITPNALFYVPAAREKKAIVSPHIIPDVAIVDPLLTVTVSPAVTAATGVDALSHAVESYTSLNATLLTDLYALEAIRLIGTHLRTAVANGSDLAAREGMARASMYAGIGIGNAGTNIVHALAYPLQGQHRVTHGVANSLLLPYGMEFNALSNLAKFATVAEALGEPIAGMSPRSAAARSTEACRLLSQDIGIPQTMREVGIKAQDIEDLVDGAMKMTRLLVNNPRQVRPEDARAIFERAL
jgi:alcohol dehydrogenase class IV